MLKQVSIPKPACKLYKEDMHKHINYLSKMTTAKVAQKDPVKDEPALLIQATGFL